MSLAIYTVILLEDRDVSYQVRVEDDERPFYLAKSHTEVLEPYRQPLPGDEMVVALPLWAAEFHEQLVGETAFLEAKKRRKGFRRSA